MSDDFYLRTRCRMCDGSNMVRVLSLAPTPPGNHFLRREELNDPEPRYPLDLYLCRSCAHVQLGHVVDPRILYQKNYPYVSATSTVFVKHLQDYAAEMIKQFAMTPGALVADIGSNDGTCLRFFQQGGMRVIGVDPAIQIAKKATESGIPTIGQFFSHSLAKELRSKHGAAAFITSHNACAHIDHLDDVMRGVAHWLQDDGVAVVEVGYLVDVYTKLWFDTIYHEHLDYHTVGPFKHLFARTGLELLSAVRVSPQGGSIRIIAQKSSGPRTADFTADDLIKLEAELGLNEPAAFEIYQRRIERVGEELRAIIASMKESGKRVAAFGATTKSTTLLSTLGLDSDAIDFIVDDNPLKQGLYSPRFHIPVVAPEELYLRRPDYLLVLAWNFAEPIMAKHQAFSRSGGKFIIPMPEPRLI